MLDKDQLNQAIQATIAKQILENLDTSARDALLQRTLTSVIGDYSFARAVEEVVSNKAKEVVRELLETDEWTTAIRETIQLGFHDYLLSLRKATEEGIKECMHGKVSPNGYSNSSAGKILGHWPAIKLDGTST